MKNSLYTLFNKPFGNCKTGNKKLRKESKMLLTINDVSQILKISVSTVYRWVHKKEIPYIKLGGKVRFSDSELQQFIKKNSISIS